MNREKRKKSNVELKIHPAFQAPEGSRLNFNCP